MPKEKFVQEKYSSGEALFEHTFSRFLLLYNFYRQINKDHEMDRLFNVWDILENPRQLRSLGSLEIIKECIGKEVNYVHQDKNKEKAVNKLKLLQLTRPKEVEMSPKSRIQVLELEEPHNNKKKIEEINTVLDQVDQVYELLDKHKKVYK